MKKLTDRPGCQHGASRGLRGGGGSAGRALDRRPRGFSRPLWARRGQERPGQRPLSCAAGEAPWETPGLCDTGLRCVEEEDGTVMVQDDLDALLEVLPRDLTVPEGPRERASLVEVILDLGRRPEARYATAQAREERYLRDTAVTREDLRAVEEAVGAFGEDNRAGIPGTLHRISALRNRNGAVVGLTCRVGRAVQGHCEMIRDLLKETNSILFLGKPGVGKTTVIRELARVLADDLGRRVVIVDTSNEIGGDGDVCHPAIGSARRMQVPSVALQHRVMIEAVENHTPQVVVVDEIGTEAEALACRSIAERGVQLIATAHGQVLENLLKNPTLSDLVGGVESVTLGDEEARFRGTQKSVLERRAPPTFPLVIEMRERSSLWVVHWTQDSVDCLLHNKTPTVQVRQRDGGLAGGPGISVTEQAYDTGPIQEKREGFGAGHLQAPAFGRGPPPSPPSVAPLPSPSAFAGLSAASMDTEDDSSAYREALVRGLDRSLEGSANSIVGFMPPAGGGGGGGSFGRSYADQEDDYAWATRLRNIQKDGVSANSVGYREESYSATFGRRAEKYLFGGTGMGKKSKSKSSRVR